MTEWISVADDLPLLYDDTLIWSQGGGIRIGTYHGDTYWAGDSGYEHEPTHWMPLPEPPK